MIMNRSFFYILVLTLLLFFSGCTGMYFRDAGKPPMPPPQFELSDWPYEEYWTGIVFNGAKIGFSRFGLSLSQSASDLVDIHSEAVMRFNFLSFEKKINLKSYDQVAADLSLKHFNYEYDLDGNRLKLNGRLKDGKLEVNVETRGQKHRQTIPVADKVYPTSIINLYPLMHGLKVGRAFAYMVYDGETQTVSPVEQRVLAFEESDLYSGRAFKIKTRLHGHEVTTWMDDRGRPLLEMSLGGVIISALESKSTAMQYLAQAAVNKNDALLDFSLIKSDIPIQDPKQLKFMEVALAGINGNLSVPDDSRQVCRRKGDEIICKIDSKIPGRQSSDQRQLHKGMQQYLRPSYIIPSNDQRIRQTAQKIVTKADGRLQQIVALVDWIGENIQQDLVDVFTALDVLDGGKAECQGHAFLYAAFARSLNIPTRVVNGIVYSDEYQGFLYHTWAESLVDGHWIAIDPTFRQIPADATHIKLVEGENVADLLPLVSLIGKLKMRVIQTD
jgi:hypothetical protein